MRIEAGVRFFAEAPVYKGYPIPFNENRLYGHQGMVAVEPFCVLRMKCLIKGLWGLHSIRGIV